MSHRVVYICDSCGSYIETKLGVIEVTIGVGSHYRNDSEYVTSRSRTREICAACCDDITGTLKLDMSDARVEETAFKDFELPKLPRDDPDEPF